MDTTFVFILFSCLVSAGLSIGPNETKCLRPNEVLACVHDCPPERSCKTRGIRFSCLQTDDTCTQKCVCKDGLYRSTIGDCISEEHCDSYFDSNSDIFSVAPYTTTLHECRSHIKVRCTDCSTVHSNKTSVRNATSIKCTGPNEHYECGSACDTVCSLLHTQNKTNCPVVNVRCNDKCYCDDGYARDDNSICIPIDKCSNKKSSRHHRSVDQSTNKEGRCNGPHEVYQDCKQTCPPDRCFSLVAKFKCQTNPPCVPGCICKSGYLRKETGSPCIPLQECPELASTIY